MIKEAITLMAAAQLQREWMMEMKRSPESTIRSITGAYSTLAKWFEKEHDREAMTSDWTGEVMDLYFRKYVGGLSAWDAKRQQTINCEKWLMQNGYLSWGPSIVESVVPRRGTTTPPRNKRLSDREFLLLLKAAGRRHARNYYLTLFMRLSGRRIGEVTAMRWADVVWDEDYIRWDNIKAKRYGRKMPLTRELRAMLEAWKLTYIKDVKVTDVRADWYLFPATTPQDLARKGSRRRLILSPLFPIADPTDIIHEAMDDAGLPRDKGDGWHIMRKTAINRARREARASGRGDSMDLAQAMADHASVATTRVYIDAQEEQERLHEWMMTAQLLDDDVMRAIPALAALAQDAKNEPASESDASPVDQVYRSDNVLDFTSRRRRTALG